MAAFNVSLDDSSPLITYAPSNAWTDTPATDTLSKSYASQSLHTTTSQSASATFTFNGTGVWFYGGHRSNYGSYSLVVDGKSITDGTAKAENTAIGQLLGGVSELNMGQHTAVLSSSGGGAIDLDSLVFETAVGSQNGTVSWTTVDDKDSKIVYLPSSNDWSVSDNKMFAGGSVRFSSKDDAKATLSFTGDAVAVYGGSSFDHGDYTVSLDGQTQQFNGGSNGHAREYHSQTLMFFATNLGSNQHNLTITNHAQGNAKFFDLDSIEVYQAANGTSNSTNSSNGSVNGNGNSNGNGSGGGVVGVGDMGGMMTGNGSFNPHVNQADSGNNSASSATSNSGISKPVIVGIVVASILGFLLLLCLLVFLISRSRRHGMDKKKRRLSIVSPVLPIQDPDLEEGKGYYVDQKPKSTTVPGQVIPFPIARPNAAMEQRRDVYLSATQPQLSRNQTTATTDTRWSQSSFGSTSTLKGSELPKLEMPIPQSTLALRDSRTSVASSVGDRSTMYDDDDGETDFADYYRDSVRPPTAQGLPPPVRPARPPGLELRFDGPEFDSIRL